MGQPGSRHASRSLYVRELGTGRIFLSRKNRHCTSWPGQNTKAHPGSLDVARYVPGVQPIIKRHAASRCTSVDVILHSINNSSPPRVIYWDHIALPPRIVYTTSI